MGLCAGNSFPIVEQMNTMYYVEHSRLLDWILELQIIPLQNTKIISRHYEFGCPYDGFSQLSELTLSQLSLLDKGIILGNLFIYLAIIFTLLYILIKYRKKIFTIRNVLLAIGIFSGLLLIVGHLFLKTGNI